MKHWDTKVEFEEITLVGNMMEELQWQKFAFSMVYIIYVWYTYHTPLGVT